MKKKDTYMRIYRKLLAVCAVTFLIIGNIVPTFAVGGGSGGSQGGANPSGSGSGHPHSGGKVAYIWFDRGITEDGKSEQGWYTRDGKWHNGTSGKSTEDFYIDLLTKEIEKAQGLSNLKFDKNTHIYYPDYDDYKAALEEACQEALARNPEATSARVVAVGVTYRYGQRGSYKGKWYFGALSVGNKDTAGADIIKYNKVSNLQGNLGSNTENFWAIPPQKSNNPNDVAYKADGETPWSKLLWDMFKAKYNKKGTNSMNGAVYAIAVNDLEPQAPTKIRLHKSSSIPATSDDNAQYSVAQAHFELKDADGKIIADMVTNEDGYTDFVEVKPNADYLVTETVTPKGFEGYLKQYIISVGKVDNPIDIEDEPDDDTEEPIMYPSNDQVLTAVVDETANTTVITVNKGVKAYQNYDSSKFWVIVLGKDTNNAYSTSSPILMDFTEFDETITINNPSQDCYMAIYNGDETPNLEDLELFGVRLGE